MLGQTISHYEIIEKLGEGGMGVVYRARDQRLDRSVALKMLPPHLANLPDERERLKTEARAEANINHPNIATIYDIDEVDGQLFIVMEYIDGQTVKDLIEVGTIDIARVLDITRQIAEGLKAAHDQGVIHRDIKSSNIMLTSDHRVKILDFGLAKMHGLSDMTDAGMTVGTLLYSSPEQLHGEAVDHRTDIWSLGVVMFEMLCGELPFRGAYTQAIMYAISTADPESIEALRTDVPSGIRPLLSRAFEKDASERFADMQTFLTALAAIQKHSSSSAPLPADETKDRNSIAVMPLSDLSPESDQAYFCDGIADELIDALSQVKDWRVVSRTSSFMFKGKTLDVREIGLRLNVTHLVEGSVRKAGNRLRITVHLIDVKDGFQVWSEKYDRQLADIFEIQEEIALTIVGKLKIKLGAEQETALVRHTTQSFDAFNIYLKARYHINERTEGSLRLGLELCERALEVDPAYAAAHAAVADCYILLGFLGAEDPAAVMPLARVAAEKALSSDGFLAEPHTTIGCINSVYDQDWAAAENSFRYALELNPGYVTAWQWFAINCLTPQGRFDEAFQAIAKARELDPLSDVVAATEGLIHYFAGDLQRAEAQQREILARTPDFGLSHLFLGRTLTRQGRFGEAISAFEQSDAMSRNGQATMAEIAYVNALAGELDAAQEALGKLLEVHQDGGLKPFTIYSLATIYAGMGKTKEALDWLQHAANAHALRVIYLKVDPAFKPLHKAPEFITLLKKISLT